MMEPRRFGNLFDSDLKVVFAKIAYMAHLMRGVDPKS